MSEKKEQGLVSQQRALTQFLDSLLMEIPHEIPEEILEDERKPPLGVMRDGASEGLPDDAVEKVSNTQIDLSLNSRINSGDGEIPVWGRSRFKALFFSVGGIMLAAPLAKLGGVLSKYGDIKMIPGLSGDYLGVVVYRGNTIRIIDFERLVAESGSEELLQSAQQLRPPQRILLIEGERIGIACREIGDVEEIAPDEVRWRTGISKRPWYRGIVIAKMCALLDIEMVVSILNADDNQTYSI